MYLRVYLRCGILPPDDKMFRYRVGSPRGCRKNCGGKVFDRSGGLQVAGVPAVICFRGHMRYPEKLMLWFFAFVVLAGCTTVRNSVTDSRIPFHTSLYSILPPKGVNWRYFQEGYKTAFKNMNTRGTHGYLAIVKADPQATEFESRDDFMKFVDSNYLSDFKGDFFDVLKQEKVFSRKFGEYCIRHTAYVKERNTGPSRCIKCHEYYFIHPYMKNVIISIGFIERGTEELFSSIFQQQVDEFIDGLELKRQ